MKINYSWYKSLYIFFTLIFLLSLKGIAQKEGNTWYFGLNAGINFNTSPPTALTNGQTDSREGVATISDKYTGRLLFYTEGTTVWDSNQQVMPNGSGLLGDYSSTQSAIIVPNPGDSDKYYIFTTAEYKGFRYSEVDMRLHGGAGDIIAATKNTLLLPENESTEKLTATRHCDGKDYWVITHTLNDNKYYVYLVTAAGIQPPLILSIGSVIHDGGGEVTSYLKVSPDGNLLADAFGNPLGQSISKAELLHFNNRTGTISGPVTVLDSLRNPYGVEFSPDGNLLYISTQQGAYIYQYNLQAANINSSRVLINQSSNLDYGALQLGPDGKIYVSAENGYNVGYGYLGTINNPDIVGSGCDFVPNAFYLGGKMTLIGLPTLIGSFFYHPSDFQITDTCFGSGTQFTIINSKNIDSVKWDFGDNTSSISINPVHVYKEAKRYNVRLIIYHPCTTDTAYKAIAIHETYSKVDSISICEGETYQLPDGKDTSKSGTYISSFKTIYGCDSIITTQLTVNASYHQTVYDSICLHEKYTLPDGRIVDTAGEYTSSLLTTAGCDSIIVTYLSNRSSIFIQYQDSICTGTSMILPNGEKVSQAGYYKITLPSNTGGCDTLAVYNISVKSPPVIHLLSDTCLILGQTLLLDPGQGYPQYEWQDGSTQPTMTVSMPDLYWVKVSNECGSVSDSIKVTMNCLPRIFISSAFTPNGDGMNDIFRILNVHGQKLIMFNVYNRWGQMVFHTTNISQGWDGMYNGMPAEQGAYIYLVKIINLAGKQKVYKGSVLLIR